MDAVNHELPDGYPQVGDVVRDVIAEVAPDELPLVDRLRQLGDKRAERLLARRTSGRDLLGFGIDEIVVLASPIVWFVLNEAAARLTEDAVASSGLAVRRWLRRRFGRHRAAAALPPFAPEQVAQVRAQVLETARRSGMDAERAELLADSVAGRLMLDARRDPGEPSTQSGPGAQN